MHYTMLRFYVLLLSISIFSCSTKEPSVTECSLNTVVLSYSYGQVTYNFSISSDGKARLSSIYYDNSEMKNYQYLYKGEYIDQIIFTNYTEDTLIYKPLYADTLIQKITAYKKSNGDSVEEWTYFYDNDKLIETNWWYTSPSGIIHTGYVWNYFYDQDNLLIGMESYINGALNSTTTFEPSKARNPLAGNFIIGTLELSILTNLYSSIYINNTSYMPQGIDYEFEYDNNGNTTKAIYTNSTPEGSYFKLEASYICS